MTESVFADYEAKVWPIKYKGALEFREEVHGGTPSDPAVASGWLKGKFHESDELIKQKVAEVMEERGVPQEEALKIVGDLKLLKGFKKDDIGIYLEGRTLKANLKEACAVSLSAGKITNARAFGIGKAGIRSFFPEHVFVVESRMHLLRDGKPVLEPDRIEQRFVHTWRGSSIQYEEVVDGSGLEFTIMSDYDFEKDTPDFWPTVLLTGAEQGLGSSRSMGFGRYTVTAWDRIS